jgi:hypothetical protein
MGRRRIGMAQRAIGEEPYRYKHYLLRDFLKAFHSLLDVRRCGIGERLVFDTYPQDLFLRSCNWVMEKEILPREWSIAQGPV